LTANATASRAVGADLHAPVGDRAREPLDVTRHFRPGAGQADIRRIDAERVHVPQDLDLLVDGRRPHRRRLQSVPQRFVVEHRHRPGGAFGDRVVIPVVDQRVRR
jgi:hypothetical protein